MPEDSKRRELQKRNIIEDLHNAIVLFVSSDDYTPDMIHLKKCALKLSTKLTAAKNRIGDTNG